MISNSHQKVKKIIHEFNPSFISTSNIGTVQEEIRADNEVVENYIHWIHRKQN